MCTTCGCSDMNGARLTDLATGQTIDLNEAHEEQSHRGQRTGPQLETPLSSVALSSVALSSVALEHEHDGHRHSHAHPHTHDDHEHSTTIALEQKILARNDRLAERNRGWLAGRNILALNLVSSPGAGKTTLLERTIRDVGQELAITVIEGDQQTLNDAERIQATGCRVVQINTGTACHLDANMLARGLEQLKPPLDSTVMIENVGNLVCPALFDLGERAKVVIVSVTEGDDKPIKYPHMFRAARL